MCSKIFSSFKTAEGRLVSQRFDKTAIKSKESKVQRPARGAFTLYLLDLARKTPPGTKLDFRGEIKGNQTG